jgi:hypothetical protein
MMNSLDKVLSAADEGLDKSIARLFELVSIPSISTDPAYNADCRRAGQWLVDQLKALGFDASLRDTPGKPMVVAHYRSKGEASPHVFSTATTTSSPPIRSTCGTLRPSSRCAGKGPTASIGSMAAAPPTTRASS